MEDSSLAPIALLIDSLRSQDAAQRLSSVKRLKTIAVALGGCGGRQRGCLGTAAGARAPARPTRVAILLLCRRGAHAAGADPVCERERG